MPVDAVLANTGQIHHKDVIEFCFDRFLHLLYVGIFKSRNVAACEIVLPVRSPFDIHEIPRQGRFRACYRLVFFCGLFVNVS